MLYFNIIFFYILNGIIMVVVFIDIIIILYCNLIWKVCIILINLRVIFFLDYNYEFSNMYFMFLKIDFFMVFNV